ncbi:MAG: arabinan endo-1,5-alpha-L-arabinosidase [Bacteroidota bacterium]|nr:arabinan endo-1,5-alpha-L-arabinosidase [Bacteroidota bacterium]MDP4214583.1 arabinan endo-1,5-alpha-L-arabinosidase [Bacteroidota bacterium]MDP4247800.1 arabinan endo-1,5-alpha-L-arabinosidase [Bacteroidota bacterium]MDP4253851.1 arabinan endo-1,5-alpha-L-arabinosidase [Bacteroidota bacterium]MDP4257886.1 arabinan endo-1,5-alpha-L-arabinosidase [Bacteroidota bacterium]
MKISLLVVLAFLVGNISAQPIRTNISVHDPVMIRQDSVYYIFCTGFGINVWSSRDLTEWKREPPVFSRPPQWAANAVPGFKGSVWAPDISYHHGRFYLYYAISAFGKNTSCIGLALNKTLDNRSPDYKWEDVGMVIQSVPGRDMWNAIDPNLAMDETGTPWLAFGSFWDGIKLVRLNDRLDSVARPEQWYTIARRPRDPALADSLAGNGAIEAPFIFRKNGWYYLFVSFDYCCRGEKSTYKMMVGRSEKIQGPYLDRAGTPMLQGGGSLVMEGDKNWYGVGHNAVVSDPGGDLLIFHGYDAHDKGRSKLRIGRLTWNNEWPAVATY